jgi:hypothetical protein
MAKSKSKVSVAEAVAAVNAKNDQELNKMNPLDMLKASAVPVSDKKKKGSAPVADLPESLEGNMKALIEAKALKENAEAAIALNEAPIISFVRGIQDDAGCAKEPFAGSYDLVFNLNENEKGKAKFVSVDKFKPAQDAELKGELAKVVGENNVGRVVKEVISVKLKDSVIDSSDMVKEFLKKMGADLNKYFDVESKLVAVKELNRNIYELAGYDKAKVAKVRELVKQDKPSIR